MVVPDGFQFSIIAVRLVFTRGEVDDKLVHASEAIAGQATWAFGNMAQVASRIGLSLFHVAVQVALALEEGEAAFYQAAEDLRLCPHCDRGKGKCGAIG